LTKEKGVLILTVSIENQGLKSLNSRRLAAKVPAMFAN
jgi:hypothetical protein